MSFFKIKNLSPAFDGLLVEGTQPREHEVLVSRISNTNVFVGDRTLSYPVAPFGLWIDVRYLEEVTDPELREFDSKNPWGECLFEGRYLKKDIEVAYARYEKATQVTLSEKMADGKMKTILSKYFKGADAFVRVIPEIEEALEGDDIDDLVFTLEDID